MITYCPPPLVSTAFSLFDKKGASRQELLLTSWFVPKTISEYRVGCFGYALTNAWFNNILNAVGVKYVVVTDFLDFFIFISLA